MADRSSEKILKKLVGRTEVEDALSRLNMLTKEESLMVMVRNLEVAHHIDGVVHDIDINVKGTWKGIEGVARGVDNGTQHSLFVVMHIPSPFRFVS
jgi:hypothetical protein